MVVTNYKRMKNMEMGDYDIPIKISFFNNNQTTFSGFISWLETHKCFHILNPLWENTTDEYIKYISPHRNANNDATLMRLYLTKPQAFYFKLTWNL
jgi:hypothetical protein